MTEADRPPAAVTLSDGAANGIIFGTLFAVLVLTASFAFLRDKTKVSYNKDEYMAARNSQGVVSLTLSYFVSGVGAWVIFAVPQAAVIAGSIGLAGYAISAAIPLLLFGWIAPFLRSKLPHGFTHNEYIYARYGPINAAVFGLVSLFYMLLYLTAELSSAGTLATSLTKIVTQESTWWANANVFAPAPLAPILGVSVVTLLYTAIGGLPVSILTDRVQGIGCLLLTIIILIAAYAYAGGGAQSRWDAVIGAGVHPKYVPTDYGNSFAVAISLIIGVTCANMVHAGYWQRVWAAESNRAVQVAVGISSGLTVVVMVLMGITGFIAYAHYGANMIIPGVFDISFLSAPWLIVDFMGEGWAVIALIFGISMIASTADTLQSAMTALLWPLANRCMPKSSDRMRLAVIIAAMAVLNVPAIILALSGQSILQLFLLADMLAATIIAPLFLGFWEKTHPAGALAGAAAGLLTLIGTYAVGEAYGEGFGVLIEQGGIFRRSAAYAFCLTPAISALVTVGVSRLFFRGYTFEGYANSADKATADVPVEVTTSRA